MEPPQVSGVGKAHPQRITSRRLCRCLTDARRCLTDEDDCSKPRCLCPCYARSSTGRYASHGRFAAPAALEHVGSRFGNGLRWGRQTGRARRPRETAEWVRFALCDGSAAIDRVHV